MKENEPPNKEGETPKPLFELGSIVGTPGALQALADAEQNPLELLMRHNTGDWGDVCDEDAQENKLAIDRGYRVFSVYTINNRTKVWVITEADRSATTLLLPSEY